MRQSCLDVAATVALANWQAGWAGVLHLSPAHGGNQTVEYEDSAAVFDTRAMGAAFAWSAWGGAVTEVDKKGDRKHILNNGSNN